MSNLLAHAERELAAVGLDDPGSDFYGGMTKTAVLEIMRVFEQQGHSGMSGALVTDIVTKLMAYETLSPLTGADDEWFVHDFDDNLYAQNKRCGHVFKRRDGTAYDTDGRIFREPSGSCFTSRDSHVDVTFPYTPTREYVDVPTGREDPA